MTKLEIIQLAISVIAPLSGVVELTTKDNGSMLVFYDRLEHSGKTFPYEGNEDTITKAYEAIKEFFPNLIRVIATMPEETKNADVAEVGIRYLDDGCCATVNISLWDCTPEGWDDDEIFFYCSGYEDLLSLALDDGMEDFIVTNIN